MSSVAGQDALGEIVYGITKREVGIRIIEGIWPTEDMFLSIIQSNWISTQVPGIGGVGKIGTFLGIEDVNMQKREGQEAVAKIVYGIIIEKVTRDDCIQLIKEERSTVEEFLSVKGAEWRKFQISGVGGVNKVGRLLGVSGVNIQGRGGQRAVARLVYGVEIEDAVITREQCIEAIQSTWETAEDFLSISTTEWKRYRFEGIGTITKIGHALGIDNIKSRLGHELTAEIVYEIELERVTKEQCIEAIKDMRPTAEEFLAFSVRAWRRGSFENIGTATNIGKLLGIEGINMSRKEGQEAVAEVVYGYTIENISREDCIQIIKEEFPNAEDFINVSQRKRKNFNIEGVGGVSRIGTLLGIEEVKMSNKEGQEAVAEIVYEITIEKVTKEHCVEIIKTRYTSGEEIVGLTQAEWKGIRIEGVGGVRSIGSLLGIKGVNMEIKAGQRAVAEIVYGFTIKQLSREECIFELKERWPTSVDFLAMKTAERRMIEIEGVGGTRKIGNRLGINIGTDIYSRGGQRVVAEAIYGIALEYLSRDECINKIKETWPIATDLLDIDVNDRKILKIEGVGGVRKIGMLLGVEGINMQQNEGKMAVVSIVYAIDPQEIIEQRQEEQRGLCIEGIKNRRPTAISFISMNYRDISGFMIPGVGGTTIISRLLGADGLDKGSRAWKRKVAEFVYGENLDDIVKEECIQSIKIKRPTIDDFLSIIDWMSIKVEGVGGIIKVGGFLGIQEVNMQTRAGFETIATIVYDVELEEVMRENTEKLKTICVQSIKESRPSANDLFKLSKNEWKGIRIEGVGGVKDIGILLGIDLNMKTRNGQIAVIEKVYETTIEEVMKSECINSIKERRSTIDEFLNMNLDEWRGLNLDGVGKVRAIGKFLGIDTKAVFMNTSAGKEAVARIVRPE